MKSVRLAAWAFAVISIVGGVSFVLLNRVDGHTALAAGDYGHASRWFRSAAQAGDVDAQNSLGTLYYHGLGVPQDYDEALHWFSKAAFSGLVRAQINMGIMHRQGFGGEQDLERAYAWFNLAHSNGSALGQPYMSDTLTETKLNGNTVPYILRHFGSLEELAKQNNSTGMFRKSRSLHGKN